MPEMKRNFTKGKMNKDLDERLVPLGEYRDAMNIQVSTSEGSDVGAIENILGNVSGCAYTDASFEIQGGSATVGSIETPIHNSDSSALLWMVAGPEQPTSFALLDDGMGDYEPFNNGEPVSLRDIIMMSNNGICFPVFVDIYGFITYIDAHYGNISSFALPNSSLYQSVTPGMTATGYDEFGAQTFPETIVTAVGTANTVPLIYTSSFTTYDPPASSSGSFDFFIRTFYDPLAAFGSFQQWDDVYNNDEEYFGISVYCQNCTYLPSHPDHIQLLYPTSLPPLPTQLQPGATFDSIKNTAGNQIFGQCTVVSIQTGMLDTTFMVPAQITTPMEFYIIELDPGGQAPQLSNLISLTQPHISWPSQVYNYNPVNSVITYDAPPINVPSNEINITSASIGWLEEIYNLLWNDPDGIPNSSDESWTGITLEMAPNSNWPSGACIDASTVSSPTDDTFDIVDCGDLASGSITPVAPYAFLTGPIYFNIVGGSSAIENIHLAKSRAFDGTSTVEFRSERVLNFEKDKLITGINVVDNMLFWTDGFTEPKKINIQRSISGTPPSGLEHTKLTYADGSVISIDTNTPIREKHITVIRKSPLTPPTLKMSNELREGVISGVNTELQLYNFTTSSEVHTEEHIAIENVSGQKPNFKEGDILRLANDIQDLPDDYGARVRILSIHDGPYSVGTTSIATATQTGYFVKLLGSSNTFNPSGTIYSELEDDGKFLFERKFPRFAYRYKYADGEYSTFSPFSNVAFLPGQFRYAPVEAYNKGMTNTLKSLVIQDFVPKDIPEDVVKVDILYKNDTSPNIYLMDTVGRFDEEINGQPTAWNSAGSSQHINGSKGSYEITTENIFTTLPSNQSIRSWDNVPKKALAQEVTGNRIVYGNYTQGYNVRQSPTSNFSDLIPDISVSISSRENDGGESGVRSIKSLRNYDVGVVWGDKYGRETPVITPSAGSLVVPKGLAAGSNFLKVSLDKSPYWADYYRFYIKETSNEYYNLAVDRVYDAEDGNIWVSFPSVDRNKVDEDTYIILKKGVDSEELLEEEGRYKIIAIENEAPDYIKTFDERLVRTNQDDSRPGHACQMFGAATVSAGNCPIYPTPSGGMNMPTIGMKSFSIRWDMWTEPFSISPPRMGLVAIDKLFEEVTANNVGDQLYVSFSKEVTDAGGVTQTTVGNKYRVVDVIIMEDANNDPDFYTIKLASPILSTEDFVVADPDLIDDDIHIHFWKRTIENKPEFDGRFFVKIYSPEVDREKLLSKKDLIKNWAITASTGLYKIADTCLTSNSDSAYDYNSTAANSTTDTESEWNNLLKFGGNSTKGAWFIDNATFASKNLQNSNNYSNVTTSFDYGGNTYNSCDTSSAQNWSYYCSGCLFGAGLSIPVSDINWLQEFFGITPPSVSVGNGESEGNVGMKGVWTDSTDNYIDISYSQLGPDGETDDGSGKTLNYNLDWRVGHPDNSYTDQEERVVYGLSLNTRFRLSGSDVIYNITGVQKFRLFNYVGERTAGDTVSYYVGYPFYGTFWNTLHLDQVNEITDKRNRRHTYRVKYEIDEIATPSSAYNTNDTILDNAVYADISSTNPVNIEFLQDYNSDFENKISPQPAIFETEPKEDIDLDLYYEASGSVPTLPLTDNNKYLYIPIGSTITPPSNTNVPEGIFVTGIQDIIPGTNYITINISTSLSLAQFNMLAAQSFVEFVKDDGGYVTAYVDSFPSGSYDANNNIIAVSLNIIPKKEIGLSWFNCWSFGNGVESNRIGDTYNKPFITNGAVASTTLEDSYTEEKRPYGLIYSGIYNSNAGVNNLNQFIVGEKITKDINPIYGSIQKLHSRSTADGDLITLCENRVLKILANKDALFNADGNPQLTATENVLGQTIPFSGEYGISKNPESFASEAYRIYFTDKTRGTVMRLSKDGLTPISSHGMKKWFRDNLKLNNKLIGSHDDKKDQYNITLKDTSKTVTFNENVKGWVSFKSFVPEQANSCFGEYYTFKDGELWKHHVEQFDSEGLEMQRNTFYNNGTPGHGFTHSSLNVILNEAPSSVKTFHTINYEGSKSKIDPLTTYSIPVLSSFSGFTNTGQAVFGSSTGTFQDDDHYNLSTETGWYVEYIKTDLEEGSLNEFIEKEGKWFNYIKGTPGSANGTARSSSNAVTNLNNASSSFRGLGVLTANPTTISAPGCTDDGITTHPDGYIYNNFTNYNANATIDDGSCVAAVLGCTDPTGANYDASANTNIPPGNAGACIFYGCTDPTAFNYDANATNDDGSCILPNVGCTDPTAFNYNANNPPNAACDGTNPTGNIIPCVTDENGAMQSGPDCCCTPVILGCVNDVGADNYLDATSGSCTNCANTDDGGCYNNVYGCTTPGACEYDAGYNNNTGATCTWCNDSSANNWDGQNAVDASDDPCDTHCLYCQLINNLTLTAFSSSAMTAEWTETFDGNAQVDYYRLRYRISGCGSWASCGTVIDHIAPNVTQGTKIISISNLNPNTSYDVQVKAKCVAGSSPNYPNYYTASAWCAKEVMSTFVTPILGCTDPTSCNYDGSANTDDGSCDNGTACSGCMDQTYLEYCNTCWDAANQVVVNDGSGGPWTFSDSNQCQNLIVEGCMTSGYYNYDSNANVACNGCCIDFVYGCTNQETVTHIAGTGVNADGTPGGDIAATNYDPLANTPCNADATGAGNNECCQYQMPQFAHFDHAIATDDFNTSTYTPNEKVRTLMMVDMTRVPAVSLNASYLSWLQVDGITWTSNYSIFYADSYSAGNLIGWRTSTQGEILINPNNTQGFGGASSTDVSLTQTSDQRYIFQFIQPTIAPPITGLTIEEDYSVSGLPVCTDPTACNYDLGVTPQPYGLWSYCTPTVPGCGDSSYTSYDSGLPCSDDSECFNCKKPTVTAGTTPYAAALIPNTTITAYSFNMDITNENGVYSRAISGGTSWCTNQLGTNVYQTQFRVAYSTDPSNFGIWEDNPDDSIGDFGCDTDPHGNCANPVTFQLSPEGNFAFYNSTSFVNYDLTQAVTSGSVWEFRVKARCVAKDAGSQNACAQSTWASTITITVP